MAALKNNGTELCRLRRVQQPSLPGELALEHVVSVRSNGWILKKARLAGETGGEWKRWMKFTPMNDRVTATLVQQVRWFVEHRGFEFEAGNYADVLEGWHRLCLTAKGHSPDEAARMARANRESYEHRMKECA